MGTKRKIKADIKRLQMAKELNKQLNAFYDDELKQNKPDDAWQKAIVRLDQHVTDMTRKHPQEQNIIIQAVRILEDAYEKARATKPKEGAEHGKVQQVQ